MPRHGQKAESTRDRDPCRASEIRRGSVPACPASGSTKTSRCGGLLLLCETSGGRKVGVVDVENAAPRAVSAFTPDLNILALIIDRRAVGRIQRDRISAAKISDV